MWQLQLPTRESPSCWDVCGWWATHWCSSRCTPDGCAGKSLPPFSESRRRGEWLTWWGNYKWSRMKNSKERLFMLRLGEHSPIMVLSTLGSVFRSTTLKFQQLFDGLSLTCSSDQFWSPEDDILTLAIPTFRLVPPRGWFLFFLMKCQLLGDLLWNLVQIFIALRWCIPSLQIKYFSNF